MTYCQAVIARQRTHGFVYASVGDLYHGLVVLVDYLVVTLG